MSKNPNQPEWYLVDGVARVWDGESWLSYQWTEPEGWYEIQGENHYWDGKNWYADFDENDEKLEEDEDVEENEDSVEPEINSLLLVLFQIESELKTLQTAFQKNQASGEALRDKIKKIRSTGKEASTKLNEEMNSITCLREWHWNYIERFEKFVHEAKSTYLEYKQLKSS
jgi:chromosome segregation ATPase